MCHAAAHLEQLEEDEAAAALLERDLELPVVQPQGLALLVEPHARVVDEPARRVLRAERVTTTATRPAVVERRASPVVLRLDVLEAKVRDSVVVTVVGEDGELEERLAPRLEHEGQQDVRRVARLFKRVLGDDLHGGIVIAMRVVY